MASSLQAIANVFVLEDGGCFCWVNYYFLIYFKKLFSFNSLDDSWTFLFIVSTVQSAFA